MRPFVATAILAILVTGIAGAQYKTPAQPVRPQTPGGVQVAPNSSIQIIPSGSEADLASAARISRDKAMKMVKEGKAVFIDVREKSTYDLGHLPGAISIPLSDLQSRFRDLPVGKFLIPYCA